MENIIKWKDLELKVLDINKSHANGGRLQKFWVEDIKSGRQFLIKNSGWFSYEPISEKIAYIIGRDLGLDVLEYDVMPRELFSDMLSFNPFCKYVSICEKIDRKGFQLMSIAEVKRARNLVRLEGEEPVTNKQVMYEVLSKNFIDTMILFDAIIGNKDRHYGNVHVLRDKDGNITGAPLIDHGDSLCASTASLYLRLLGDKVGDKIDESSTMAYSHDEQVKYISSITTINFSVVSKTIQILTDIEPTLQLLPKARRIVIKNYITYRLHKYIDYVKNNKHIMEPMDIDIPIREKEHT